ncbi:MAG: GyrI-like domain-containing protein [Kribbellaceae bacterium]|nr:GyrI-like domain-containing protein [Kribbellaceae bacterium]
MHTEPRNIPLQHTAVVKAVLRREQLGSWFSGAIDRVADRLDRIGIAPCGLPFARYHLRPDHMFEVEAGFPVAAPITGDGEVRPSTLPGGSVVVAWHIGPYDRLGEAYEAVDEWLTNERGVRTGDAWEVYHDPPTGDPHLWRTEVVQPFTPATSEATRTGGSTR